jgi:hypothetical protein
MYESGKMRPNETVPGMGAGERGMMVGVNSTMIYCKNFGKCHDVPLVNNMIIKVKTLVQCVTMELSPPEPPGCLRAEKSKNTDHGMKLLKG